MAFLDSSIDWFLGVRSSHMGVEQYMAHDGRRNGRSTSGALLWAQAEADRMAAIDSKDNAEKSLLLEVERDIGTYIPYGTVFIELGPGTVATFNNKVLPIVDKLDSKTCIFVDQCTSFLNQITEQSILAEDVEIRYFVDDFFENDHAYCKEEALVCSLGSTISNIVNPISSQLPEQALVRSLENLSRAANNGWILVSFDSDHDGERIKGYFQKHALFQLNIFDRMAAELPIAGDFDPLAFTYEPEWIADSGQLAHVAAVARDMRFDLAGTQIHMRAGQKLHIKNCYKFAPAFFERCCRLANLAVVKQWSDASSAKIYLLKIPSRQVDARPVRVAGALLEPC